MLKTLLAYRHALLSTLCTVLAGLYGPACPDQLALFTTLIVLTLFALVLDAYIYASERARVELDALLAPITLKE